MLKERVYHQPLVIFTTDNIDADKPIPVVILPPVRFIGDPTIQKRTGSKQESWYPEISVAVITTAAVPVEDDLDYIGKKNRNGVIHMEFYGEASWVNLLGEVWKNQGMDQWVDLITNPSSRYEVPKIYWLVSVFHGMKKNHGRRETDIN